MPQSGQRPPVMPPADPIHSTNPCKLTPPPAQAVSIIIVNYNTRQLLLDCLDSVSEQSASGDEVIVVDNRSADGSADAVAARYPKVRLIRNMENRGFARANNQGLAAAENDWIWFLNPDTRLMAGARDQILAFLCRHPAVGLAGTMLLNPDGSHQPSVEERYPGQRYAPHALGDLPGAIAWVSGASMVARRTAIDAVGGFDEQYPLYGEELDLCLMLRRAGWAIGWAPDSRVVHIGGQSQRDNTPESVWTKKFTAELIFYQKHYPPAAVQRIKRKNRLQAAWRLLSLAPLHWCLPKTPERTGKYTFYRMTWKMFR